MAWNHHYFTLFQQPWKFPAISYKIRYLIYFRKMKEKKIKIKWRKKDRAKVRRAGASGCAPSCSGRSRAFINLDRISQDSGGGEPFWKPSSSSSRSLLINFVLFSFSLAPSLERQTLLLFHPSAKLSTGPSRRAASNIRCLALELHRWMFLLQTSGIENGGFIYFFFFLHISLVCR